MIFFPEEGACIILPPPTYIPTWLTCPEPSVVKNTISPGCKFDLLTVCPNLACSFDVLGIDTLIYNIVVY